MLPVKLGRVRWCGYRQPESMQVWWQSAGVSIAVHAIVIVAWFNVPFQASQANRGGGDRGSAAITIKVVRLGTATTDPTQRASQWTRQQETLTTERSAGVSPSHSSTAKPTANPTVQDRSTIRQRQPPQAQNQTETQAPLGNVQRSSQSSSQVSTQTRSTSAPSSDSSPGLSPSSSPTPSRLPTSQPISQTTQPPTTRPTVRPTPLSVPPSNNPSTLQPTPRSSSMPPVTVTPGSEQDEVRDVTTDRGTGTGMGDTPAGDDRQTSDGTQATGLILRLRPQPSTEQPSYQPPRLVLPIADQPMHSATPLDQFPPGVSVPFQVTLRLELVIDTTGQATLVRVLNATGDRELREYEKLVTTWVQDWQFMPAQGVTQSGTTTSEKMVDQLDILLDLVWDS